MSPQTDDDLELARWLEDSGRRRAFHPDATPEKMIAYLEKRAGVTLRSTEEIDLFFRRVQDELEAARRAREHRRVGRELVFIGLLAAALAQYYFVDIAVQISRLHSNYYFVAPR